MAFGGNKGGSAPSSTARDQGDIVRETIPAKPAIATDELALPGLQMLHQMSEKEMTDFFAMALRTRANVSAIDLLIGNYEYEEKQSRIPNTDKLATQPLDKTAQALAAVLMSHPCAVGFRATIEMTPQNVPISRVYLRIAKKEPVGPTQFDPDGKALDGDEEWAPVLKVDSRNAFA